MRYDLSTLDLTDLASDGDEIELPDGRVLRLTVQPDEGTSINDYECYGRTEWSTRRSHSGRNQRPDGFTGAARKMLTDSRADLWWEPYREGHKVYDGPADAP